MITKTNIPEKGFFIFLIFVFIFFIITIGLSQAQTVQKKISLVNETVKKISPDEMKRMHEKLVSFENRNTYSDTVSNTRGIGAARRWIYSEYKKISDASGGRLKVYYDEFKTPIPQALREFWKGSDSLRIANVVALLPGKTDDYRFIINGHYDSRASGTNDITALAPGADDDASGTIVAMELARVMSQYEFDHTIMFVADIAEEQGLFGARNMASMANEQKWEIGGVIANDMVSNIVGGDGSINNSVIRVFSPDPPDSKSRHWARYVKYVGEPYVPDISLELIYRLDRFGRGGDHSPFTNLGFPGIRFTEKNENFERQHGNNTDRIEFMSYEYMTKVAKIQAAILTQAANAPRPVTLSSPSRNRADYSTLIRWTHPTKETDIAGFKVFIRKTDSGYWQEIIDIGMPEKTTQTRNTPEGQRVTTDIFQVFIPFRSVDDYIFGISSYDKEGYEGIVATYEERTTTPRR
jgi:hypothetical protein